MNGTKSLICNVFGHDWSEWLGPVDLLKTKGLDLDIERGERRYCHRCGQSETRPMAVKE